MTTLKNADDTHSLVDLDEVTQIEQELQKHQEHQEQQTSSSDWTSAIDVVELGSTVIDAVSELVSSIDLSL